MTTTYGFCACGCGQQTTRASDGSCRTWRPGHNRRAVGSKGWIEHGYRYICFEGTRIAEHRHLVQQREGRKLASNEVVHHVDGDPINNDLSNLVILTRSEHNRLHRTGATGRSWTDAEKARAADLSSAGMTIQEVSDALGRPFSSTRRYTSRRAKESRSSIEVCVGG